MSQSTNYLKNAIGDAVMLDQPLAITFPLSFALYTAAPDETGGGTEVTGGGYARQGATFSAVAGEGVYANDLASFTDMPAADVVAIGVFDNAGNLLFFDTFTAVTVTAEDTYVVKSETVTISFDPVAA